MKNSAHAEDSSSSGGRQRVALVEEDSSLCLGGGCYITPPLCISLKQGRGKETEVKNGK